MMRRLPVKISALTDVPGNNAPRARRRQSGRARSQYEPCNVSFCLANLGRSVEFYESI
jgi:hypothetical protein